MNWLAMRLRFLPCLATALVPAQDPASTVDWRALANAIEPQGDQDVLTAIPADLRAQLTKLAALMTDEERDIALREAEDQSLAGLAAAAAALAVTPDASTTPPALLTMAMAAGRWHRFAIRNATTARMTGQRDAMWTEVSERAERRASALVATLLREHANAPAAGLGLLHLGSSLPAADQGIAAWSERLVANAGGKDLMPLVRWLRRRSRITEATSLLSRVVAAEPPRTSARAELLAVQAAEAAPLLAVIADLQRAVVDDTVDAEVRRLRLLALTDPRAAIAESRTMVAAEFPHAAPSTLVAGSEFLAGNRMAAEAHLQRALRQPGADTMTAALAVVMRLTPKDGSSSVDVDIEPAIEEVLHRADTIVAKDSSAVGKLFRGMRELGWPIERQGRAMLEDLAGVRELAAELPDSLAVHRLLLAAIPLAEDQATARAALLAEPAPALRAQPSLVRLRAEVATMLALQMTDAGRRQQFVEPFLQALAATPRGAPDASLLRGILAWSDVGNGADAGAAQSRAATHFAAAKRLPFDRGAWPAASSHWIAADPGDRDDEELARERDEELARVRAVSQAIRQPASLVPMLATYLALGSDRDNVQEARRYLGTLGDEPVAALILHSALAEAAARSGDRAGARAEAKQALALRQAAASVEPFLARGVLPLRQVSCRFGIQTAGPELEVGLQLEFHALPDLPSVDRLRQLAADD